MRALVFDGQLRQLTDVAIPRPVPAEALIRVRMAGICGTDLEIVRGYSGFTGIIGHEFVGEVIESADPAWNGRRVCGEINAWCGACDMCRRGLHSHCLNRTVLGIHGRPGAFADFLTLPLRNLHSVPDSVDDEDAVMVEPLAAAFQILEQMEVMPSDRVLVLGDGKLGFLCAQVLALTGCAPTLVGRHEEKLKIAREMGLDAELETSDDPEPADIVVEATGSPTGIQAAMAAVRPRGTIVLKSTVARSAPVDLSPLVVKEITVIGSRCGTFDRAIGALASGVVEVKPLISHRFPFDQALDAVEKAGEPDVLKVLLEMDA